jgi:uncharacterized protein
LRLMKIDEYRHPIFFYGLSTAIPWSLWIAAAYVSHIEQPSARLTAIASALGLLGLLCPLAVAMLLIWRSPTLRADFLGRLLRVRGIKPIYLPASAFLMLLSVMAAQAISLLFGFPLSQFSLAKHFSFSSGVFPVWFLLILAPAIEEMAWHSYGTDCLRRKHSLLAASMIFAAFWGLWHIPLSFIKGYYQSNLVETGSIYAINFLVSIFPFTLIMNWLYYKTGRSVLVTIVFHISAGYYNEVFATHPASKVIQTGLLVLFAAALVVVDRAYFLDASFGISSVREMTAAPASPPLLS